MYHTGPRGALWGGVTGRIHTQSDGHHRWSQGVLALPGNVHSKGAHYTPKGDLSLIGDLFLKMGLLLVSLLLKCLLYLNKVISTRGI